MNDQQIQIFTSEDGQSHLEVTLEQETVWLSQAQMCELFGRERSVITKHIRNVFKEGELERNSVCAKFAHTAEDGKSYQVDHKQYLIQGYTLNQRRLTERGIEFEQAVNLLSRTLTNQGLVSTEGEAVARVISAVSG